MFKYKDKIISPNKSWKDDQGVVHPSNWHIWDSSVKKSMGITEIIFEEPPNSSLYVWTHDEKGKIIKTAKPLNDSGSVLGVKSILKNEVKHQQGQMLLNTDWAIIRKADKGTAIPSNIQTWRDSIRTKATAMETAIDNATNTAALDALFLTWDNSGNKSGILFDWPQLSE